MSAVIKPRLVSFLCFLFLFMLIPLSSEAIYASPGDIALVSISQGAVQGNGVCISNAISADGRYVVFISYALNLVPGGTSTAQVLRKDMDTGEVRLCNANASGVEGNAMSVDGDISSNGRLVVFHTDSSNLDAADTNTTTDVYRKDLSSGAVLRCSTSTGGGQIPPTAIAAEAAISGDGKYVVFHSTANNLHSGDTDTNLDIFRKDLATGQLDLCDTSAIGTKGNNSSEYPDVSGDGRYVVFESGATNLLAAGGASSAGNAAVSGTAIPYQVFRKDMQTDEIVCVSTTTEGQQGNNTSERACISDDGRYVVFQSAADNLVPGDTNGAMDVFRKDLVTGELMRCSTSSTGAQGESITTKPSISPDGRFVAFASTFKNMVPGDTNNLMDVFRKDCLSGETVRASTSSSGGEANNTSDNPVISWGGEYVAFDSGADNLIPGDGNGTTDVFRKELATKYTWYFAEGYTGSGFQEYLCLGQPVNAPLKVTVTYMFKDGTTTVHDYHVNALSRFTVNVNAVVGPGKEVSMKCEADSPFLAERPMYFDYTGGGGNWTGGHDVMGAAAPSLNWYFAEGYTGTGFDEWVCVLNPGDTAADLTFRFQTQEEGTKTVTGLSVPAHSRGSFKANQLLEGKSYQTSLVLESTRPVVAERPMYFNYQGTNSWNWTGGHCVMGVPALAKSYYFAEGSTRAEFEEWLTLQNPGTLPITVNAVYHLGPGQGAPVNKSYVIEAGRRSTVYVPKEVGASKDVSVHLSSASYFLAERPMYFNYQGTNSWNWTGGHCVIGAMGEAYAWYFAEGYTGAGFEEWLCLQNTGTIEAKVEIIYYPEGGGAPITKPHTVPAGSRYTVPVNRDAGSNLSISTEVMSDHPIIVERPMYFDFQGKWTGGHAVVGYAP